MYETVGSQEILLGKVLLQRFKLGKTYYWRDMLQFLPYQPKRKVWGALHYLSQEGLIQHRIPSRRHEWRGWNEWELLDKGWLKQQATLWSFQP